MHFRRSRGAPARVWISSVCSHTAAFPCLQARGSAACSASVNSHRESFSCLFRAGNTTSRLLQAGRGGREYSIHHVLTAVGDEPTHHSRVGNS